MRIFHTSDWHLGQTFYHHARDYEHGCFLAWLSEQLQQHQPDVLIVAGDIFDTVNPPISAQRMLYDFLADTHQHCPQLQMILIAGNHDSGGRIELPAPLLARMNTHMVGRIRWSAQDALAVDPLIFPIWSADQTCLGWCLTLPYLRPAEVTAGGQGLDTMAAIDAIHARLFEAVRSQNPTQLPVVLISHAHLQGASASPDSERNIVIGSAEALSTQLYPDDVAYVALGHLHKPQRVGAEHIRYSGSPIPLSFSERHYPHQVLCVDVQAGQAAQITPLLIPRAVAMLRIPSQHAAPLEDIIAELQQLGVAAVDHPDQRAWLEVVVLLDGPAPLDLRQQIEAHVPKDRVRLVRLRHEQQSRQTDDATSAHALLPEDLPAPQQLFERVWEQHYASPDRAVYADFAHLLQVLEQEEQP